MNAPLIFQPYLRPMVWGGRRLGEILGRSLPTSEAYGEAWEVSDHPSHQSIVSRGALAGTTLRTLMDRRAAELVGPAADGRAFPWLIKLIDAGDWLSVQVHPDDAAAAKLWPGEGGKTEAWFIRDAAAGSRVYAGLLPGVGETELRAALATRTVADCLHQFQPRPGDCLFLPAGTVHAVGGGVLMAEVQQTSDATFRLYDWDRRDAQGRSRQLHIEQALACIDWRRGPVDPVRARGYGQAGSLTQRLVECPFFHLDYLRRERAFVVGGSDRLQALIVLHGRGSLPLEDGPLDLSAGTTVILPASMPQCPCTPEGCLGMLLATLP
jgi:mannose-6-phosphate isomerase